MIWERAGRDARYASVAASVDPGGAPRCSPPWLRARERARPRGGWPGPFAAGYLRVGEPGQRGRPLATARQVGHPLRDLGAGSAGGQPSWRRRR